MKMNDTQSTHLGKSTNAKFGSRLFQAVLISESGCCITHVKFANSAAKTICVRAKDILTRLCCCL